MYKHGLWLMIAHGYLSSSPIAYNKGHCTLKEVTTIAWLIQTGDISKLKFLW